MNLEDVIDSEYGLQQDDYSLSGVVFGDEGQLQVVGWSGKRQGKSDKFYILKCSECSQDSELFGEGYFKFHKYELERLRIPCGCVLRYRWSEQQYHVLCSRKAKEIGYKFMGFQGEWGGNKTKVKMSCDKHGKWDTGIINNLINSGYGCPHCAVDSRSVVNKKPDEIMIASFFASGAFHPDTEFWRSDRKTKQGYNTYWFMSCPECGEIGESVSGSLQGGKRPCACSKQRQQECYINWIVDCHENAVAVKFGIARDSKHRIKNQNRLSIYEVRQYQVYSFPSVASCKQAERECKKELECGVVLKRDMPDGYSETTWAYNIGKVKNIYERNGGVLV